MKISERDFQRLETKAELLKTMGHPIRLAIIRLLHKKEKLTVTQIFTTLELEQAVVSHHLRLLKSCKAVNLVKSGKNSMYFISDEAVSEIYLTLFS